MKQTAIDFIVKELDILHRERKEKVIDAETFFKHKGVLIQLAKEKEKKQAEWQPERISLMEIELNHTKTLLESCEKALEDRDKKADKMDSKNVWIQVIKELPEFGKPVLILTDYGKMDVCYLRLENNRNIVWVNHMRPEHTNGSVIAWINLPII